MTGKKRKIAVVLGWVAAGLEVQRANGGWPQSIRELGQTWGVQESAVANRLKRLVAEGFVETAPFGLNSDRKRYRFVDFGNGGA